MDAMAMEEMLRLLIQGMETVSEALQLALMKYQDQAAEERLTGRERRVEDE